jgi:probable biosynthetic protein (TIGR04098 family)
VDASAGVASAVDRIAIDPCPGQNFNGADFLYVATCPAFVDRADWAFFRPAQPLATTRRPDIVYRGNIDPGRAPHRDPARVLAAA